MRAFHFLARYDGTGGRALAAGLLALSASLAGAPLPVAAQFPGHLEGTVTDAVTGAPVAGAVVTLEGQGRSTTTDADGAFRLRSLESGTHTVAVSASGYADGRTAVEVEDGSVARISVELEPAPLEVAGVEVAGDRRLEVGAVHLPSHEIRAAGASHLGEVLDGVPGVTIRSTGPGGTAGVSIRGSALDAVLVLVDGIPLNDPVTGEADLSTLPAGQIEDVTVLPGSRTARFGPRAQGGVILVETRAPSMDISGAAAGGSLGRGSLEAQAGRNVGGLDVGVGGSWDRASNAFAYRIPEEAGGGEAVRTNADMRRRTARLSLDAEPGGHRLRARLQAEDLLRGLPGKSFAPSPSARQDLSRLRGSVAAVRSGSAGSQRVSAAGTFQRMHQRDPEPPMGRPYDVRPRLAHGSMRMEADRAVAPGSFQARLEGGVEVDHRRVDGADLDADAPSGQTDAGVWAAADVERSDLPGAPELRLAVRLHRDGLLGEMVPAHDATLHLQRGAASFHLSHRSSYSPPTLGDQYFKEGVAVEPNPDLAAERVRGEWEAGASGQASAGPLELEGEVAAFRADVDGMIVWMPDFRFVWSPRNVDVNRRGAEARLRARHEDLGLRAGGSYTLARVTYDRGGGGGSQVLYRPRHQGSLALGWDGPRGLGAEVTARYLGTRYPVPTEANALPSFWTFDLSLSGELDVGGRVVEPSLRVDRVLDRDEPFIFAFPEPGRTWEVRVRMRPSGHR